MFLQAEEEYSRHNFEHADTAMLFEQFKMAEAACKKYLEAGWSADRSKHLMALPSKRAERPDPGSLDRRYAEFRAATA